MNRINHEEPDFSLPVKALAKIFVQPENPRKEKRVICKTASATQRR